MEEEEEEEMWSTLTGRIKHNAGGAEDTRTLSERAGFLCAVKLLNSQSLHCDASSAFGHTDV